uniref:Uncharacterized protein n=1 Tax=Entomoneis paludosa TaxID=265537 RepID=A0A7S2Y6E0_9STRA
MMERCQLRFATHAWYRHLASSDLHLIPNCWEDENIGWCESDFSQRTTTPFAPSFFSHHQPTDILQLFRWSFRHSNCPHSDENSTHLMNSNASFLAAETFRE